MFDLATTLEEINSKKLVIWIVRMVVGAIIAVVFVSGLYFLKFHGDISTGQDIWGQFGDYLGGTLNPIFGFLGLIVLVLTLALQSRQLELAQIEVENSKQELKATRDALDKSTSAQEQQAQTVLLSTKLQSINIQLDAVNAQLLIERSYINQLLSQAQIHGSECTIVTDTGENKSPREILRTIKDRISLLELSRTTYLQRMIALSPDLDS
jgi:uncharacterized membrane protein